jgi:hypothetical protein
MRAGAENLTGVWQGLYSYPTGRASVSFVATLIESGRTLSGMIHEPRTFGAGLGETIYAMLLGGRSGSAISFVKSYEASAGRGYGRVDYEGTLSGDGTEIEGRWSSPGARPGKFLMIRSAGKAATIKQKKSIRV